MELSRTQCLNIKGYAILLIVVHNFVDHLLGIYCNEMAYLQENTDAFLAGVVSPAAVWQLFAFAGWIGVALFLFLSGYGLERKYGTGAINTGAYVKHHVVKLWKLLVPIYLLYFIIYHYVLQQEHNWQSVIAQLTFTINLLDYGKNGFLTEPGVYWFFGAVLQCYLLYLLMRRLGNKGLYYVAIISLAVNYLTIYALNEDAMWWVRQNALGWMVPFVMGILTARTPQKQSSIQRKIHQNSLSCLVALPILALCLTVKVFAPLTEVFTILLFVGLTGLFSSRIIGFCGAISASLFVIHPFVRMICYNIFGTSQLSTLIMVIIYLAATFLLAILHHMLLKRFSAHR